MSNESRNEFRPGENQHLSAPIPQPAARKRYPILKALKKYYGYDSFRQGQQRLIEDLLSGRDILAIMPTGAGKSVCYQIPGIFMPGITLVISPLISLMKDQVAALKAAGIPAAFLNSSLNPRQYRKALSFARQGKYKIIYVAPERLMTPAFLEFAGQVKISMIAVDEAHCVSQWGQNFRPSYLDIAEFAASLPQRPVMAALTATATGPVKSDILSLLRLHNPDILTTGFDRPNLYFAVKESKDKFADLQSWLQGHPGQSGIIYCLTRKDTEDVCDRLNELGYPCGKYHGGMNEAERSRMQEDFIYDRLPLMAATNAFGMGIDKSNVRFVVHYSMPSSLENYYQEAGRAGRDGAPAECLLLFAPKDLAMNHFLIDQSYQDGENEEQKMRDLARLNRMEAYARTTFCLRSFILEYFGESSTGKCGNCSSCQSEWQESDITDTASVIYKALLSMPRQYGITLCQAFLKGSVSQKIRSARLDACSGYGSLARYSSDQIRQWLDALLMQGFLQRSQDSYQVISVTPEFHAAIKDGKKIIWRRRVEGKTQSIHSHLLESRTGKSDIHLFQNAASDLEADDALFEELRKLRRELASKDGIPPYLVFNDRTLKDMAAKKPENKLQFLEVSGVGPMKADKYGTAFLSCILRFRQNQEQNSGDEAAGSDEEENRTEDSENA